MPLVRDVVAVSLKRFRSGFLFLVSFGLTLAVLASVRHAGISAEGPITDLAASRILDPIQFSNASEAYHQGDFPAAREDLEAQAAAGSVQANVLLGLYAHAAGDADLAFERLQAAEAYRGELADWRLWALAETAGELERTPLARAVLWRLIQQYPDSPLRSRAARALADQARDSGDWLGILTVVQQTYGADIDRDTSEHLARLFWHSGIELDNLEIRKQAARTILVDHPLVAPELDVVELFRLPDGEVPWSDFLSPQQLLERSRSLLAADLADSALDTLDEIEDGDRGFDWKMARSRALTAAHRGNDALEALEDVSGANREAETLLAWERARAALDYSTARRGRGDVTSEERAEMRQLAHHQLRLVAEGPDVRLAKRALGILFEDLFEDERFDESLVLLRKLQSLVPLDTTGARALWGRGWKEYTERNYSGAIGYWSVLAELYPRSNYNRSGLYWSARGHQELGNPTRAQEIYRQVTAVGFTDFYRRHALGRLDSGPARMPGPDSPTEPWPQDQRLDRIDRLYRLALQDAALLEIDTLRGDVDRRALEALRARILAAKGERRQSILALRRAFPLLGTPHQGLAPQEARRLYYPLDFQQIIEKQSQAKRIPSHLVFGMIRQESAFDASAKSWAGAHGLMQIMPSTGKELARRLGLRYSRDKLSDPEFSITLGTSYFQQVLNMFGGDEVLALAGYNAGPYRIKRLWRQAGSNAETDDFLERLSYSETRNYVKRVLLYSDSYRRLYDEQL